MFNRLFNNIVGVFKGRVFLGNFKVVSRVSQKQFKKVSNGLLGRFQGGNQEGFKNISKVFHKTLISRVFQGSLKKIFQVYQRCFKHYRQCCKVALFFF